MAARANKGDMADGIALADVKRTVTAKDGTDLAQLLRETSESREPIRIVAEGRAAVLVPQEDWSAIEETLYLMSIAGMRESIREGLDTSLSECGPDLPW